MANDRQKPERDNLLKMAGRLANPAHLRSVVGRTATILREQGAELRQELSETALTRLTNLSYRVEEAAGELAERTRDAREEAQARTAAAAMRAADLREDIEQRLDEAKDELAERTRDAREEAASRRAAAARHAASASSSGASAQ